MTPRISLAGNRNAVGHTLIEILLVISILTALAALAVPRIGPVFERIRFEEAVHNLVLALQRQRLVALTAQRDTGLEFDPHAKAYREGLAPKWNTLPGDVSVKLLSAQEEMSRGRLRFRFYPDGSATGGQIMLERNGLRYVLDIDWLTGKVSLHAAQPST